MRTRESKAAKLREYLDGSRPALIGDEECAAIARELAPGSERYLRELLRDCGVPLAPLIEGVRQDSFTNLERTLLSLDTEYGQGDATRRQACREIVISAKDHARFSLRRLPEADPRRAEKDEMALWMLTWLENPPAFPAWLELRKRQLRGAYS